MEFSTRATISTSLLVAILFAVSVMQPATGQMSSCTSAMVSSFTPCMNFITGSSGSGSSPTQDCCKALENLIQASSSCSCLLLSGSVPLGIPINRTISLNLLNMCGQTQVPLFQCQGTGTGPGNPFGSMGPPMPPFGQGSGSLAPPPVTVEAPPPATGGLTPFVLPSGAVKFQTVYTVPAMLSILPLFFNWF